MPSSLEITNAERELQRDYRPYRAVASEIDLDYLRSRIAFDKKALGLSLPYDQFRRMVDQLAALEQVDLHPVEQFSSGVEEGRIGLYLRHDIDVDPVSARYIARAWSEAGIAASFYVLHTAHYAGRFDQDGQFVRHTNALLSLLEIQCAYGCEVGLHTDGLGCYFTHGVDGAQAVTTELAELRSLGFRIRGHSAHNSCNVYGAENFELFSGRSLNNRPFVDWKGKRLPLGVLDETALALTYEANWAEPHELGAEAQQYFLTLESGDSTRDARWMREFLVNHPFVRWGADYNIWLTGNDKWTIGGDRRHDPLFLWNLGTEDVLAFVRSLKPGQRVVSNIHPLYVDWPRSERHGTATRTKAAPVGRSAPVQWPASPQLRDILRQDIPAQDTCCVLVAGDADSFPGEISGLLDKPATVIAVGEGACALSCEPGSLDAVLVDGVFDILPEESWSAVLDGIWHALKTHGIAVILGRVPKTGFPIASSELHKAAVEQCLMARHHRLISVEGVQPPVLTVNNDQLDTGESNAILVSVYAKSLPKERANYEAIRPEAAARIRRGLHPTEDRPLRVLHIGNIANNAYLIAKMQNRVGGESDVLMWDYYHIMGCPEWEDADLREAVNEFAPDWGRANLGGFKRPRWVAQGPRKAVMRYLMARRANSWIREFHWHSMTLQGRLANLLRYERLAAVLKLFCRSTQRVSRTGLKSTSIASGIAQRFRQFFPRPQNQPADQAQPQPLEDNLVKKWSEIFDKVFPYRTDHLTAEDLDSFSGLLPKFTKLAEAYDLVHAYGSDPIWGMLQDQRPYIAYEHSTIRHLPFQDSFMGRLTALAYRLADGVVITNSDCHLAAQELDFPEYRFVPHPLNEDWLSQTDGSELRDLLCTELDADFLCFHPPRQHWRPWRELVESGSSIDPSWYKANDIFYEGFARFVLEVNPKAALVVVEWGASVDDSRRLLNDLGIADRAKWIPPQASRSMLRYIDACDLLVDQFWVGAFGTTMPKAMPLGKPAMCYVEPESHSWCLPEMPPVLNARRPDEVFTLLTKAYDEPEWLRSVGEAGRDWYERYHSNTVILERLSEMYARALTSPTRRSNLT